MAIVLDAVVGSLTGNAYATVLEADAYHEQSLYGDAWADLDDDVKQKALIAATRLLDENVAWAGYPTSYAQPLGWPRVGVATRNGYFVPSGTVPLALKQATAAFAALLAAAGTETNTESENPAGLKKLKAGPIELEFDPALAQASGTADVVPAPIWSMIAFLIEGGRRSRINVPLYRT